MHVVYANTAHNIDTFVYMCFVSIMLQECVVYPYYSTSRPACSVEEHTKNISARKMSTRDP